MPEISSEQQRLTIDRARQLFRYLKAYAERRSPFKRTLAEHDWTLRLRGLPAHTSIVIGEVLLNGDIGNEGQDSGSSALLTVRRPKLTNAPAPARVLHDWLEKGWQEPAGEIRVRAEVHAHQGGDTVTEAFDADPVRVNALAEWRSRWEAWAAAERPARDAMRAFERMYQLYSRTQLESERVELMLGDGQLRWQRGDERLDHPILLQRVQLEFDPDIPELRLTDADRGPELFVALLDSADGMAPQRTRATLTASWLPSVLTRSHRA